MVSCLLAVALGACSGNNTSGNGASGGGFQPSGGSSVAGGSSAAAGGSTSATGGSVATGGASATSGPSGGTSATGGTTGASTGGASAAAVGGTTARGTSSTGGKTGGTAATGGSTTSSGTTTSGGRTGGTSVAGGSAIGGGTTGTGGRTGSTAVTGGSTASGGTTGTGGSKSTGGATTSGGTTTGGTTAIEGAASFHCVNWADPRDNYVNGLLELSGLSSSSDTYATVQTKAGDILSEFQSKLKANAIRVPINEPTVSGTWWNAYKAVIDTAVGKGMKVVIAYWAYHNGKPDSATAFKNMWQVVVSAYQSNNLVYFDIHNEPYGYSSSWNDTAAQWLTDFPNVPKGRVIVAGTGYDDTVTPVGSDSRFAGCLLQLHIYGFWHDTWTTQKQWSDSMKSALGSYSARTLVGEWGAPMTTGTDYSVNADGDTFRSYVRAVSDVMHDNAMGSCYWPGLRNADSYSMTTLNTSGSSLTLTVNSTSGLDRLHWAWQL
jgi:endoglucanase